MNYSERESILIKFNSWRERSPFPDSDVPMMLLHWLDASSRLQPHIKEFRRKLRFTTGFTSKDYLISCRIGHAINLMKEYYGILERIDVPKEFQLFFNEFEISLNKIRNTKQKPYVHKLMENWEVKSGDSTRDRYVAGRCRIKG